jgi:hypothetical protein
MAMLASLDGSSSYGSKKAKKTGTEVPVVLQVFDKSDH